jgi:hypothetical protein
MRIVNAFLYVNGMIVCLHGECVRCGRDMSEEAHSEAHIYII